jgi:hypothetical protein
LCSDFQNRSKSTESYIKQADAEIGKLLFDYQGNFPSGDISVSITLKHVAGTTEKNEEIAGYSIDGTSRGRGFNSSMFPGYAVSRINEALPKVMQEHGLSFTTINNAKVVRLEGQLPIGQNVKFGKKRAD